MSDQVDALVTAITPGLGDQPGVTPRDVVLVIGPWLAGTTSLLEALRRELPDQRFVGADELGPDEAPAAVVFAVSAVAPLTESDCVLLDAAAANTDLVIGAVTKIDLHRPWRDVLAADRKALAAHDDRYRDVTWVGAAAAPQLGEQQLDELVDALQLGLADPELTRRNRLRAWQFRIDSAIRRCRNDVAGMGREAAALRDQRREVLRRRRLTRSERTIELRSQIQQARVQLTYFARNRCTSARTELHEDAAGATRRRLAAFESYVRTRVDEVVDDVNGGVTAHLTDVAVDLGLTPPSEEPVPPSPPISSPPLKSQRLETRLIVLLGAGFGLGVAFTLSRVFAGLAPGYAAAGLVAGAVVGLAVALWVVSIRGLLYDRAVLDRWVSEVMADVRAVVEQLVATRVLRAETTLTAEESELDQTRAAELADRVSNIDAELREHELAGARVAARSNHELPTLQTALDAVYAELNGRTGTN